ncbi:MAG: peptidase S8/S53 subtilisin kexin sedolisin [uncultured bacterium]|nr:MAG: peptidase S8/S53 subtilisin kexin sedolisin [uncultured bacterium]
MAAGNSDDNALNYSPAAFNNVLTVSALADFNGLPGGGAAATCRSDQDDTLADFSNWGSAIDIAAPGVCILSTYPLEKGQYGTISGTSMASPYVAGALALQASVNKPGDAAAVKALYSKVVTAGNLNWTDDSGDGIQEKLLDVSTFAPTMIAGGSNTAPVVHITSPANNGSFVSGASISFAGTASDVDGNLSGSLEWTSDINGPIGTGNSFSSTALSPGTHIITATATDNGGLSGSDSITITVSEASGITLTVMVTAKVNKFADLTWDGAVTTNMDVFRNGNMLVTTANDGAYRDNLGKGSGTATYQVCENGTTPAACSNSATVSW